MLPSFRVRNVRRPTSPPAQQLGQSPPKGCYDAIVRITAAQYDRTISSHPEATLNYVDEDREVITVGSSLELAQRLQEPVVPSTRVPELSQVPLQPTAPSTSTYPQLPSGARADPASLHAKYLLMQHGFNDMQLSDRQFEAFRQQNPIVQQKSIQVYAQNLIEHQRAVKAALPTSKPDPLPQRINVLMQHARHLSTRADHQIQGFRQQIIQEQQKNTSGMAQMHVFDLDSKSENALNIWRGIELWRGLDMDSGSADKVYKDARPYAGPTQQEGHVTASIDRSEGNPSDQANKVDGDAGVRPARDERQHYFEITDPPQLNGECLPKAAHLGHSGLGEELVETSPLPESDRATHLTLEGKRQAQAAGDKIRARCNPLYEHTDAAESLVPDTYQNRWASYSHERPQSPNFLAAKPPKAACIPPIKPSSDKLNKSLLEVFEAELAKLSIDTQKIDPSEGLEGALSMAGEKREKLGYRVIVACGNCRRRKIRCLGLDADLQGRCSNCIRLNKECTLTQIPQQQTAIDPPTSVPSAERAATGNESEPTVDPGQLLVQTIKLLVDGVGSFTTELRSQVSEAQVDGVASSQNVPHALGHGLRNAFRGFASCVQNIAETVQNASDVTRNMADRTRAIDTQVLEGAVRGLQGLAGGITAFGRDLMPTETRTTQSNNSDITSGPTAYVRQDVISGPINDLSVEISPPVELLQPPPTMKDESSADFDRLHVAQIDEVGESTEAIQSDPLRRQQVSPVSALSEGLKELNKSGGSRKGTEAEIEHQECTVCHSLWPDKCYWHISASLPYKSDTMERGRQSQRSALRSTPALTHECVATPPALRAKEHLVDQAQDLDCTSNDSHVPRSRSRSPPPSTSRRFSPSRRSSPSGWPRFHGPGPIHLPQDVSDSINQRRERRHLWRSRRQQQAPKLNDGPLSRRGNEHPPYLAQKSLIGSVFNNYGDEFRSSGGRGRSYQHQTSEQPIRGNLSDRSRVPHLRFEPSGFHTPQPGTLRHHQSTPALGRPQGPVEANKLISDGLVRNQGLRNELPSGRAWGRAHRRAQARDLPRYYTSLEDVENFGEDFKAKFDPTPNGALTKGGFDDSNVSRQDTLSSPVITHFPTLEQFEGATFTGPPRFPPLPSMEPLIPSRPENRPNDSQESRSGDYEPLVAKAADPTLPKVYPSAWPHQASGPVAAESSGDFFKRMTGLTEASKTPAHATSPAPPNIAASEARLMQPFDPLADNRPIDVVADTAMFHGPQLFGGVRRSNTVADLGGRYNASNRRPYSEFFSGEGRVGWDTFVKGYERGSKRSAFIDPVIKDATGDAGPNDSILKRTATETPTPRLSYAEPPTHEAEVRPRLSDWVEPTRSNGSAFRSEPKVAAPEGPTAGPNNTDAHADSSTVRKVQECVDQLTDLGFGTEENGGLKRLVVYAQAAEGDLEDAIEMIEEERTAYKQRFF